MNTWEEVEQQPEFGVLSPEDKASLHKDWHENVLSSLADEDPEKVDSAGVSKFVATEKARNESFKTGQPFDEQTAQQAYAQQVKDRAGAQKQMLSNLEDLDRAQFAKQDAGLWQQLMTAFGEEEAGSAPEAETERRAQIAADIQKKFTPEQLQQVKEAKATLNGERPTAVLDSDLYTDPALVLDKDKYRAAVAESNASPEAKARAMADFTSKRKQVAEQALRVLRVAGESPLPGALDFPSWEATQPEDVRKLSPEDKALQYMRTMQGRGDFRKLTSAIGTGLLQGGIDTASQGLGVAAMVANSGELAKQAAEVSEGASTLEEESKLEGDKQATGATTAGGAARLLTPMAAAIAPAALTGGASLPVAAGLSGLQTAGAQFPNTYKALIDQGVPEEQALTASRNAAITSGLITTALTAAFGKTGAEAALLTGAGGKELVKSRLLATLKGAAKGSAAEIPEELLDEAASQVIEQRTIDPNKPVSQIVDEFAQTAPDLAMQIALLGGVGGGVGGYRDSTTTPGGAPTVPVPGTTAATPQQPETLLGETPAPAGGLPVQVEGVTIANIPEGSPLTPEDVAEFAAEPDTMKMMARQGLITLPEIVTPLPGVDPAITEAMNENIATSAALAPQTVEALKVVEAEGAARNAEVLREAAARLAGTEKGPDLGFPKVPPVTTETETPSNAANVAGGSQSVQTEPAEGSIPAVTGDTISTSDIASTAEIQPTQADESAIAQPDEGLRDEPAAATEGARAGEQGQAPSTAADPVQREQPQVTNNVVVLSPAELETTPEDLARAKENQKEGNERWQQAAASTEPISVLQLPDGRYRILDGHHRVLNAIAKGEQIQAIVEKPWTPTINEPATFTAVNGQKVVGTVSHIAPNGKATVSFIWNGKDTSVSVPTSQLSRPITSLADGPKYVMTQEQNTRKAGKHFPTTPGVHENFDFNKAFASMADDTSLSKTYREVARLLSKLPGFSNVDLHVVADGRKRYAGEYSHHNGKSAIAVNLRQVARGNVDALGTILHEALHHLTMAKVHNPQGDVELDAVAAIHQLRQKAEKFAKTNGQFDKFWYEFSNNDEFITGLFTRQDFQEFLASVPDSNVAGKFRSILSEVFRRIAELLTGKHVPAGSTLEQSIASTLALFETPHRGFETGALEKLSAVRSEVEGSPTVQTAVMFDGKPLVAANGVTHYDLLKNWIKKNLLQPYQRENADEANTLADQLLTNAFLREHKVQEGFMVNGEFANRQEALQAIRDAGQSVPGATTEGRDWLDSSDLASTPKSMVEDSEYAQAVEAGNVAKQQELVDAAAKDAGYTIKAFHGLSGDLQDNSFDFSKGQYGRGTWLTDSEAVGKRYGKGTTLGVYLKPGEVFTQADYDKLPSDHPLKAKLAKFNDGAAKISDMVDFSGAEDELRRMGYSAIAQERPVDMGAGKPKERHTAYFVFGSPSQIKSADPVTYKDGKPVPLSQRFNPASGDTRFSLAEDGAIDVGGEAEPADGTGKQLYQKNPTAIGSTYTTPADITLQEKKTQEETLAAARTIIGESVKTDGPIKGRRAALDRFRLDTNIPPEVRAVGTGLIAQQADILANLEEGNQQLLLDEMTDEAAKLSGVIASDPDSFKNLKADANLNIDKMAEEAGRTLNIFNVFRRLTPEGFLRRMTRKYNDAVREKVEQNFDVPVEKVESEIALLRRLARESTSPERRKAILAAIKAYQQHDIDTKKLIEALFPQAGFRDRMNKGGEALVRNFFQIMAGPRDGKGPLAEFDETIQNALSSMLRKVMEAQGLVAKNESAQMTDIDKMVRSVSGDELRFDKIAAADEAMQKELADIKDPERRAVLQQAWEEATAKMFTNIASDATVRRAINAELKSANVDWTKMFDGNQKPAAIRAKVVEAVMGKIEALLTDPNDPTVQNNLGMLRDEVGAAFDFIADNKRTQWLAQREAVEARRRVAEHRAAFMEALRNQGVAEQAINRISEKLAGPQRGKPDQNPVSALVGEHMKKEVADFVDKLVALDVDRTTAEKLDKAASTLRTEIAAAEKLKAADRAVKELMKSLKPKPRAPREKIEKSLRALFTADTVGALDDQAFFDAFGEAFGLPPLSGEQQDRVKKLVREINSMPKGPARLDKQQDLDEELALWKGIAARDVLLSAWYANILSGVSTQGMGMLGNLLNFVPRSLFNAIANPRSAGAYFKGALGEGLSTGIEEAKAALKGRGLYKVSKYGDKNLVSALELLRKKGPSTLPEWVAYIASAGTRLRYVFRIMQAIDALAWNTAREGHAYLAAHRALLQQEKETGQKRSPEEFYKAFIDSLGGDTAQIEEDLRDARQKLIDVGQTPSLLTVDRMARETRNARRAAEGTKGATRFADRIVLQQDPEGSGKFISSLIEVFQKKGNILGLPVGQMLIPFNKIVSNLFEQSLDYTPVGALRAYLGGHLSDVKGISSKGHVEFKEGSTQFDPMERRERAMAATAGMAAAAIMYALAHAHKDEPDEDVPFMVYGWGPESKNKRAQMPKGWIPYSVKMGDQYIKFSEMPFGMMFAAAGSAMDAMRYKNMDKKTSAQRLAYILKTSVKGFLNQGVMSSLDTAMETMMFDASEKKMTDIPINAVKGFIPAQGMLRDISTIMDPNKVSTESLTSALLRDIPFAKGLATKPELNVFGEPIKMDGYPILRRITTHREPHAVADYLGRNDLSIPGMEPTIEIGKYLPDQMKDRIQRRAVELGAMENGLFTPEQNYEFKKRAGQLTKVAVESIMSQTPKITNDVQRKHIQSLIDKRVEVARRRAMLEAVPAQ